MERLEDRALLSVTTAEYAEIQTAYPELELPEDVANINVIEIEATNLTVDSLKAAIAAAGESTGDDLVVVRTTDEANAITFENEADSIGINIDSSEYGALKVVGFGTQALTIDGQQLARVFAISNGNVGLANLTVVGGSLVEGSGAGISVTGGSTLVTKSTITGNVAMEVGGGVNVDGGAFTALNTTISGNNAVCGGGLGVGAGSFTSTNSTISDNFAMEAGGGLYVSGGSFVATNTTISKNTTVTGGGAYVMGGATFTATNTEFWGNVAAGNEGEGGEGGAVFVCSEGVFSAINTTIAGNAALEGDGVYVADDGIFTATNVILVANYGTNLDGELADGSSNNFLDYYPMFVEGPVFNVDGTLANADTIDLSLRSDSPAINAGSNAAVEGVATDLAGNARIAGDTVDIGAYEFQNDRQDEAFYSTVVDTLNDSFDLTDGEWSLREAIYYASKYETITFAEGLSGTLALTQGELKIDNALAINGAGRIAIDAGQNSRVMYVDAGTTETPVVLKGLTIQNGKDENGGGIYLNGALNATNVVVFGNNADVGAGVYVADGAFAATNVTISGNTATNGGGVYVADSENASFTATNVIAAANYGGNIVGSISEESANNLIDDDASFICAPQFDDEGNLTNAGEVDLRLFVDSAAIDAGSNAAVEGIATDLGGNKRVYNGAVDIGAYEFQGYYVVDTLNDSFDLTDGEWSLREALYYASENEYETIAFAADLNGSIELALGELTINKAVVVDGDGRIMIDANLNSRALNVTAGTAEKPVALKNLTIQNGVAPVAEVAEGEEAVPSIGGGVLLDGVLTTTNVTITNNAADCGAGVYVAGGAFTAVDSTFSSNNAVVGGAVYVADGAFTATGSTFADNIASSYGGGVFVSGGSFTADKTTFSGNVATTNGGAVAASGGVSALANSTISGNSAEYGGGVAVGYEGASLTVTNVTISGNSATYGGGVAVAYGGSFTAISSKITGNSATYGGGLVVDSNAVATVKNSAITANVAEAGGAVYVGAGTFDATNDTISGNSAGQGGGVLSQGTFNASNTIVAWNYGGNVAGSISSGGNNITDENIRLFVNAPTFDGEGKLTNADALDLNLRIHSLAIDRGSNDAAAGLATDLNGDARIKNNTVDIGAYEYQGNYYSTVVDTLEDVVDDHDGKWSLREAVNQASSYQYITFAPELNGTIKLTGGALTFNQAISIDGDGRITLDAQSKSRVAYIGVGTTSAPVVLKGLTLQNGYYYNWSSYGGAIYLNGVLSTENVTIKNSYAVNGGAVCVNGGTFNATTTTFSDNHAFQHGGAVFVNTGATFKANSVVIAKNYSEHGQGGGVYVWGGTFNVTNATIVSNSCWNGNFTGGGVAVDHSGTMVVYNSIIVANSSDNIYNYQSTVKGTNNLSSYTDWGSGNYVYNSNDRLFKNLSKGDYRLQNRSQALNKGSNARATEAGMNDSSVDMIGNPRFNGSAIDIGAYEFDERLYAPEDVTLGVYDATTRTVKMTWIDATYNETGFRVEYSIDGGQTWRLSQLLGANTTSRTAWGVKQNATYQFRVCAVLDGKLSDWAYSETLNTTPTAVVAPSNFTFGEYDAETRTVETSWQDNSDDETGFRVEYSTDGGQTWRLSQIVGANTTSRTAWGVKADSTYDFRVCALRGALKSKWAYSETLDTSVETVEEQEETADVLEPTLDVFNDTFNVPASGLYKLTQPVAVPVVAQVAVCDVVFEGFAKDDALDFNDDSVQTNVDNSEKSLFVELFDDLLEVEF